MSLPNPSMSFSPFAILTAEELNDMVENIESLSNGTGFVPGAIDSDTLAQSAVRPQHIDYDSFPVDYMLNFGDYSAPVAQNFVAQDIPNASTTVTTPVGYKIEITFGCAYQSNSGVGNEKTLRLRDGSNNNLISAVLTAAPGFGAPTSCMYVDNGTGSPKTYKLSALGNGAGASNFDFRSVYMRIRTYKEITHS